MTGKSADFIALLKDKGIPYQVQQRGHPESGLEESRRRGRSGPRHPFMEASFSVNSDGSDSFINLNYLFDSEKTSQDKLTAELSSQLGVDPQTHNGSHDCN